MIILTVVMHVATVAFDVVKLSNSTRIENGDLLWSPWTRYWKVHTHVAMPPPKERNGKTGSRARFLRNVFELDSGLQ